MKVYKYIQGDKKMNLNRNDHCWCGSNKKYKNCHLQFDEKINSYRLKGHIVPPRSIIKTPEQIEKIKESYEVKSIKPLFPLIILGLNFLILLFTFLNINPLKTLQV